jgi:hypothetical protein
MQTITKTVTRGIYNRVPTHNYIGGVQQYRHEKTGETTTVYNIAVDDSTLTINGNVYRLEYAPEYAIKIMKTKVKTCYAPERFIKSFCTSANDLTAWIDKVIANCKPIKTA